MTCYVECNISLANIIDWKKKKLTFSDFRSFLPKNLFPNINFAIMPILLECSKILNAYISRHKDMIFSNISCKSQLCCSKITQWGSHWNVEKLGFLKLFYFHSTVSHIISLYKFWMFKTSAWNASNEKSLSLLVLKLWLFDNY